MLKPSSDLCVLLDGFASQFANFFIGFSLMLANFATFGVKKQTQPPELGKKLDIINSTSG